MNLQATGLTTEIIAHRGASFDAPENTLASVRLAWEHNADAVEIDVHLSKDNHIVVMHDAHTQRTGGLDRRIAEQTLEELRTLDVGSWKEARFAGEKIPTLSEVIETIPQGKRLVIEVKCGSEIVPTLQATLAGSGRSAEQFLIITFSQSTLQAIKAAMPHITAYWLSAFSQNQQSSTDQAKAEQSKEEQPTIEAWIEVAHSIGADGLNLSASGLWNTELVQAVKAAGLKCYAWTVNDVDQARRLIAMGIDGITTDRAGWLRERLLSVYSARSLQATC
ncbi:MAG: glycerophosphoryl diester phosphodiesterase [Abditibacteriota bacterium]|nr:glycerophosphoryl diester phosphodiesterase [Abditibacteriota bacterium]